MHGPSAPLPLQAHQEQVSGRVLHQGMLPRVLGVRTREFRSTENRPGPNHGRGPALLRR